MVGPGSNPNWPDVRIYVDFLNPGASSGTPVHNGVAPCALSAALSPGGGAITSLPVTALTAPLAAGTKVVMLNGTTATGAPLHSQVWTLTAPAALNPQILTNGDFEVNLSGWTAFGGTTLTRVTTSSHDGIASMQITWPTGGALSSAASGQVFSGLTPGDQYTIRGWLYAAVGQPRAALAGDDNAGGNAVFAYGPAVGVWQHVTLTYIVPASGVMRVLVWNGDASTAGQVAFADSITINKAPPLQVGSQTPNFAYPAGTPVGTWTDLTPWCRRLQPGAALHTERGQSYERGQTNSGVINFILDNSAGLFDSSNSASPFYPNVKPIRKIKVEATWGGVTYHLWAGRVEDWPRVWKQSGFWGEVTATGRGVLSSLSNVDLIAAWVSAALINGAVAIYRLNEPSGDVSAANSSSFQQLYAPLKFTSSTTTASAFSFGSNPGSGNLAGDPSNSLTLTPEKATSRAAGYYLQTATATDGSGGLLFPAVGPWSWEGWFNTGGVLSTDDRFILDQNDSSGIYQVRVYVAAGTSTVAAVVNGTGITPLTTSTVQVVDNNWHHVVITFGADSQTLVLYVDGVANTVVAGSTITPYLNPSAIQVVGTDIDPIGFPAGAGCFGGSLKNLAWYNTILTPTQVANHFAAGQGFPGEDTGARIARILAYAPYDLVLAGTTGGSAAAQVGNSILGAAILDTKNVVAAVEDANNTEVGTIIERGDGYIVFEDRQSRGGTTAVATFGETGFPYEEDINIQQDPRLIYTNVVISRNNGITITDIDTTAELDYFPRTLALTSYDNTDTQALGLAQYLLWRYKVARDRIPVLTLKPSSNAALWPQALGREIGDRVTVTRNNPGAPAISGDFYIDKITHDVAVGSGAAAWTTKFMLSTSVLYDFFILDSPVFGLLDSTTYGLGF